MNLYPPITEGLPSRVFVFTVENWNPSLGKATFSAVLGEFSLASTDWKEVVIPLEGKHEALLKSNGSYFALTKPTAEECIFVLDDIVAVGESGEMVLCDFEKDSLSRRWSKWYQREAFKDDPVYQAIWNDPLYKEISGPNFQTIGMNTFHLASVSKEYTQDLMPPADNRVIDGETMLCEQLKGMPMIPGYTFVWGFGGSRAQAEAYAKRWGLPLSIIMRHPNGGPVNGYNALCPEDPLGQMVFKELWQRSARHLLKSGANIYAYELVNENSGYHDDACQYNRDLFIRQLREKHGDIAALNKFWGTDYPSFEAVLAQISELGGGNVPIKGLNIEWEKFMEDRYVAMFQQGGKWIHEVEDDLKKPHALMGQMGYPTWDMIGYGGADMYKMARGLDVIQTEGGVGLGSDCFIGDINPLTAVMASKGQYGHQMALDLADAACPDKPVINTEHYLGRYKGKARETISRTDIITSLWEEFLRGASAVHTYHWGVEYASREDAIANGENRALLSPYLFPRDSLNGYKDVQDEIARVAEVVMERPRLGRTAECAVLFSRPTARYLIGVPSWVADWKKKHPFYRSHENFYNFIMENHYPMRYLYEEQLPEGKTGGFRIIFVPHSDNIYPETLKYLADFVTRGGTLVCFGDAFRYDEYGNDRDKESSLLLGLKRKEIKPFVETVELTGFGRVTIKSKREIGPDAAQVLVKFPKSATPFVLCNQSGQGRVYYVNADMYQLDADFGPVLGYLAQQTALKAPLAIVSLDGAKEGAIEANLIEHRDKKLIFMVNWAAYQDRVVKISLTDLKDQEKYYLVDIARNSLYAKEGEKTLSGKELKDGINLFLPSQERVVLLLTKKRYKTPNEPLNLLSDTTARQMEDKIKAEQLRAKAREGKSREIVFGIIDYVAKRIPFDQIRQYIKTTSGDTVQDVTFLDVKSNCTIRNYGLNEGSDGVLTCLLVYRESMKDEEIDAMQARILEALVKQYNVKVIKGYSEAEFWKLQKYVGVGNCLTLDIRKQANMGLVDEKADDQKDGLFDEGRSLVNLPLGKQQFAGVPFEIIDPAGNNGKACIVLKGQPKPYFPEKTEGIEVKRKFKNLYVLHNACYCGSEGVVYKLRLNYVDGSKEEVEIRAGSEIKDWFNRDPLLQFSLPNAKLGWQGKAQEKAKNDKEEMVKEIDIGLYCAKLVNPHPEKEVTTMDLVSANGKAVPAIFAVTVENNQEDKNKQMP